MIDAAHKLGAYVITADYLPDNIAHRYSDEYVNVSIIDRDAVLKVAREKQIDGILSFGVDPGVVTAAYVAEKMDLPSPPLASVEILQNKDKFRDFLAANGFNCPWHKGYVSKQAALNDLALASDRFPVIVKPVDSAGSKGCMRVDSFEALPDAIDGAMKCSASCRFIVEQYLELSGRQTGSDCFAIDNELVFCTFGSQYFDVATANAFAPIANVWPSVMPSERQAELEQELARLVRLLDLGTTILNVETRVAKDGRAYIMEISPRGGGNRIAEVLRFATGQDLITADIYRAFGMEEKIKLARPQYNGVWAYYVLHSAIAGKYLASASIEPKFKERHVVDLDEWFSPGDSVNAFTGANQSLGTLIMRFDSLGEAEAAISSPDAWLRVNVG